LACQLLDCELEGWRITNDGTFVEFLEQGRDHLPGFQKNVSGGWRHLGRFFGHLRYFRRENPGLLLKV
jgi:hypothetical protein